MADLTGKTIIVTGAGSGIGKAAATLAAAAGATVIAADVKGAEETAKEIGGSAEGHVLDVTDSQGWKYLVDDVIARHGRIHGLANVAGIVSDVDALLTQTEEGWQRILDIDLKGAFLGMKSVAQHLIDNGGGKIVNVASTAGVIGMPNVVAYSAAKGGVIAMSRQVAIEYAATGLRVNVIAPGVTQTNMLGDITDELLTAVKAATPTGEVAAAEDQANAIVFLLGPGSDRITGQVLPIDGGWTAQ
ncbi:SDR family NAD(P)-dependent oxidoreductase [Pseudonocardia pini]|uniref:SDR family NAD(P)-dependent oxidoreductase n=1 Tax=Pseudonocardia pini TaxID=2758030 RepID=UPI001C687FF3|nr:SDR family NAD(P)-dependent oxidoreductase [Pseudonocardia pini]